MSRLLDLVVLAARIAVGLAFAVLAGSVLLQVGARTFLPRSPVWTEELTRFALLYMVAFGAGLSLRSGDLVNVDIVLEMVPKPVRRGLEVAGSVATAAFALILILPSFKFMQVGTFQTSPALGWRMDWIFASMLLAVLMLALFGVIRAVDAAKGKAPSLSDLGAED